MTYMQDVPTPPLHLHFLSWSLFIFSAGIHSGKPEEAAPASKSPNLEKLQVAWLAFAKLVAATSSAVASNQK